MSVLSKNKKTRANINTTEICSYGTVPYQIVVDTKMLLSLETAVYFIQDEGRTVKKEYRQNNFVRDTNNERKNPATLSIYAFRNPTVLCMVLYSLFVAQRYGQDSKKTNKNAESSSMSCRDLRPAA